MSVFFAGARHSDSTRGILMIQLFNIPHRKYYTARDSKCLFFIGFIHIRALTNILLLLYKWF